MGSTTAAIIVIDSNSLSVFFFGVMSKVLWSNAGGLAKRTRVQKDVVQFVEKTLLGLLSTTLASSYLESLTLVRQ